MLAIIKANAILDTNVLTCMDENVACLYSVNNKPKVWTIHASKFKWAQCDCPIHTEDMVCKHIVQSSRCSTLMSTTMSLCAK